MAIYCYSDEKVYLPSHSKNRLYNSLVDMLDFVDFHDGESHDFYHHMLWPSAKFLC